MTEPEQNETEPTDEASGWGAGATAGRKVVTPPTTPVGPGDQAPVDPEITYTVRRVRMTGSEKKMAILGGVVAVVGIGIGGYFLFSGDDDKAAPAVTTSTAPTGSTTTLAPGSVNAAQARYFEVAGAANTAVAGLDRSKTDFESVKSLCEQSAAINTKFAEDLRAFDGWGAAAETVKSLAAATEEQAAAETECAAAAAEADLTDIRKRISTAEASAAQLATKAREELGLPPDRR